MIPDLEQALAITDAVVTTVPAQAVTEIPTTSCWKVALDCASFTRI